MSSLKSELLEYSVGENVFEAYICYDTSAATAGLRRPTVIICHAFLGRTDFEQGRAEELAKLGYVAVAIDVFGKGITGKNHEEGSKLMKPLKEDRDLLLRRLVAALGAVQSCRLVDTSKIIAIGYCFGGMAVLDIARNNLPDILAVVCIHGIFELPNNYSLPSDDINATVLILHAYGDSICPPNSILAVSEELKSRNADWQLHIYGKEALHGFTRPGANYNSLWDRRSWITLKAFLEEQFSKA